MTNASDRSSQQEGLISDGIAEIHARLVEVSGNTPKTGDTIAYSFITDKMMNDDIMGKS